MALRGEEFRDTIGARRIEPDQEGRLSLEVQLKASLNPTQIDILRREVKQAVSVTIDGIVGPIGLRSKGTKLLKIALDPIHPGAVTLESLMSQVYARTTSIGDPLAAALAATVAGLTHRIHEAPDPDGQPRVHGQIHPSAIILTPAGTVALIGCGLPILDTLLVPPVPDVERYRYLSPEAARGEPINARTDVYALGVLFYGLLTTPYRNAESASRLAEAALQGATPDLPGTLPNPRPSLIQLFQKALSPDPRARFASALDFAVALQEELTDSNQAAAGVHDLTQMIASFMPSKARRGSEILVPQTTSTKVRIPTNTPTRAQRPAPELVQRSRSQNQLGAAPASNDVWAKALGIELTSVGPAPSAPAPAATVEAPPETVEPSANRISSLPVPEGPAKRRLPLPDAPSTSQPTQPSETALPSVPTLPASPSDSSPLADLYEEKPSSGDHHRKKRPRKPGPSGKEDFNSKPLIGAGLAIVAVVVTGIGLRSALSDPSESTPDAALAPLVDAGNAPPPVPQKRSAPPDAGVKPKPVRLLTVISIPSGATVEIDGGYVGKTPLVMPHNMKPGNYRVTVLMDGHKPWERMVRPDPKLGTINVTAVLQKK